MPLTHTCPAKVNLVLSITGKRPDGFHALRSLVARVELADTLSLEPGPAGTGDSLRLAGADTDIPAGADNLVLRAARLFREATGWSGAAAFTLEKRIPAGAGLGGGSSDAVGALRLLDAQAGHPLEPGRMQALALQLGSDCPLFLRDAGSVMSGRGEALEPLPPPWRERLAGRPILLFRPGFAIGTPWAYRRLAAMNGGEHTSDEAARKRIETFIGALDTPGFRPANDLTLPAFDKFLALNALLNELACGQGLVCQMTGSGSACFALAPDGHSLARARESILEAWGPAAFCQETRLLP